MHKLAESYDALHCITSYGGAPCKLSPMNAPKSSEITIHLLVISLVFKC